MVISLPADLEQQVTALTKSGGYSNVESLLRDALGVLLAARPDLREAVACTLYAQGVFSLGKAAEWSGLSIEILKEALHRRGVTRQAPESLAETEAMARRALKRAGRSPA